MSATVAKKKGRGIGGGGSGNGKLQNDLPRRVEQATVQPADIEVTQIVRCTFQPRQNFPEDEIRELANSIALHGQVHPIAVRPGLKAGTYELVDGERRWRAVKLLGLKTIRAEICDYSDAQVRAITLATALQRKELNAIEEAEAFRAAIAAGDAAGPSELAKQLGLSQGHVSNRLRLLELPEKVQAKVISREITATNARTLVPLQDAPAVIEAVIKKTAGKDLSTSEFEHKVDCIVRDKCRRIDTSKTYDWKSHCDLPPLKLTDQQRADLQIITRPSHNGKPLEYAQNVKLYEQLRAAQVKAAKAKELPKKGAKDKPLTPAEQAAKEKERAEQFARRLYEWKEDWMRFVIAENLRTASNVEEITRVFMLALTDWRPGLTDQDLDEALGKVSNFRNGARVRVVFAVQDFELDKIAGKLAAAMFFDKECGPRKAVDGEDLEALCEDLAIDFELEWSNHQAGPLSESYWRLHTKDQLIELAGELKAGFSADILRGTKDALVDAFVARIPKEDDKDAGLPLPKEIKKAKRKH